MTSHNVTPADIKAKRRRRRHDVCARVPADEEVRSNEAPNDSRRPRRTTANDRLLSHRCGNSSAHRWRDAMDRSATSRKRPWILAIRRWRRGLCVMSSEVCKKNFKTSKTIVLRKPPISGVLQIVRKFLVVSGARHGASFLGTASITSTARADWRRMRHVIYRPAKRKLRPPPITVAAGRSPRVRSAEGGSSWGRQDSATRLRCGRTARPLSDQRAGARPTALPAPPPSTTTVFTRSEVIRRVMTDAGFTSQLSNARTRSTLPPSCDPVVTSTLAVILTH